MDTLALSVQSVAMAWDDSTLVKTAQEQTITVDWEWFARHGDGTTALYLIVDRHPLVKRILP